MTEDNKKIAATTELQNAVQTIKWKFRRKVTPLFSFQRDPLFRLKVTPRP